MNKSSCYYIVKARTAFTNFQTDEIEFRAREKKFENENPILAREAAFVFRNEYIYGMLAAIGISDDEIGWNSSERIIENLSDREIRKLLNPYLELENESVKTIFKDDNNEETEIDWIAPDDTLSWYSKFSNGVWVIMKHNDNELSTEDYFGDIVIDKISRYEEPLPTPPIYQNLQTEFQFYRKHSFETRGYETSTLFFDDEQYLEGFYLGENETDEEAQERHLEEAFVTFEFLKTPFDWTGYDKVNCWENPPIKTEAEKTPKEGKHILPVSMEEALEKREHHFAEFKPGLINWVNNTRDMEYENVQAICAFLNAKGGYLFIGIADKGQKPIGLRFPDNSKDLFLREFTRIKSRFLSPSIVHTIYGDFYTFDEKEIFVVTVYPSNEPIFLRKKDATKKVVSKEFSPRWCSEKRASRRFLRQKQINFRLHFSYIIPVYSQLLLPLLTIYF